MHSFRCALFVSYYCLSQFCNAKETLPLFLIDYGKNLGEFVIDANPFARTNSLEFTDIIEQALKRCSVFLIFVEDQFCTEDVSSKDGAGTPYVHLQSGLKQNKVKYFPSVVNPVSLLSRPMHQSPSNVFVLKPGHPIHLPDGLSYYYIYFNDVQPDEKRVQMLRRHDMIMHEVFQETRRISGSAIAIYTGRNNPVVPSTRGHVRSEDTNNTVSNESPGVHLSSDGALFYFIGLSIVSEASRLPREDADEVPKVVSETRTESEIPGIEHLRTSIEYQGLQIKFSFRLNDEFWNLENVTLIDGGEDMGTTIMDFNVPISRSYYCNEPLIVVNENDKSYIRINEYKIQPFRSTKPAASKEQEESESDDSEPGSRRSDGEQLDKEAPESSEPPGEKKTFAAAVKCNPYFDIPILSGLFISAICLSILMVGIVLLFQCEANDHFDDPRSKPLEVARE